MKSAYPRLREAPLKIWVPEIEDMPQTAAVPARGLTLSNYTLLFLRLCIDSVEHPQPQDGHFSISDVPNGTYIFKTTKDGFQSVTGSV
jgi:hypothetical protein